MNTDSSAVSKLHRRALRLSYFTVGYNLLEGAVSIFAGLLAGSIALIGFGLDSFVESLSGGVMVWRFRKRRRLSEDEEEAVERKATSLVAYTFLYLAPMSYMNQRRGSTSRKCHRPAFSVLLLPSSLQ